MPATATSDEYGDDHAGDQDAPDNRPEANEPQPTPTPAPMPTIYGRQRRRHSPVACQPAIDASCR